MASLVLTQTRAVAAVCMLLLPQGTLKNMHMEHLGT